MLISPEFKGYVTWSIYFSDLLEVRYNCAKFHHCRIYVTDFREGVAFLTPPPIREQPWKSPSWIGLSFYVSFVYFVCIYSSYLINIPTKFKSSHPDVFLRKGVLRICSKFTGEHPCRSVQLYWNHTAAWVFSCKFDAYFQNIFS